MANMKRTLVLDFDGVLHSYTSKWTQPWIIPDKPVPGAMDFLHRAIMEFEVCIFSTRNHQQSGIDAMRSWLLHYLTVEHGLEVASDVLANISFPLNKPPAHLMIDDRAWLFEGTWPSLESIHAFKRWYKKDNNSATSSMLSSPTTDVILPA